jgi:hypothetical protein
MQSIKLFMASFTSLIFIHGSVKAHSALEGMRIGLQVGFALTGSKVSIARTANCSNCGDRSDIFGRGIVGGFTIDGSQFLDGTHTLVGIELSANFGRFSGRKSVQGTIFGAPAESNLTTTVGFQQAYDLSAKVGHMIGDNIFLPYFKLGPSWARWKIRSQSDQLGTGNSSTGKLGVVAGFGVEIPLEEHFILDVSDVTLGIEYAYRQYAHTNHDVVNNYNERMRSIKVLPSVSTFMFRISHKVN